MKLKLAMVLSCNETGCRVQFLDSDTPIEIRYSAPVAKNIKVVPGHMVAVDTEPTIPEIVWRWFVGRVKSLEGERILVEYREVYLMDSRRAAGFDEPLAEGTPVFSFGGDDGKYEVIDVAVDGHTTRWKVDETLIKVNKKYHYLYRAIDSHGHLVETKLSEVRTLESTTAFLEQAARTTGQKPTQLTTDKDATYPGATLKVVGKKVEHRTSHYLNNRMGQDHRGTCARYKVMKSFKNPTSGDGFCQAFDEQRNFFKFQRWHKDRRSQKWQRGNFKSKFYELKKKFCQRKQFWQQSALPLQV